MASRSPAGVLLVWDHDPPTDAGDEALVWLVAPEQIVEAIRDAFHFASPRSPQGKRPDGLGDSLAVWCRTVSPTVLDARMSMPSMVSHGSPRAGAWTFLRELEGLWGADGAARF